MDDGGGRQVDAGKLGDNGGEGDRWMLGYWGTMVGRETGGCWDIGGQWWGGRQVDAGILGDRGWGGRQVMLGYWGGGGMVGYWGQWWGGRQVDAVILWTGVGRERILGAQWGARVGVDAGVLGDRVGRETGGCWDIGDSGEGRETGDAGILGTGVERETGGCWDIGGQGWRGRQVGVVILGDRGGEGDRWELGYCGMRMGDNLVRTGRWQPAEKNCNVTGGYASNINKEEKVSSFL